MFKLAELHTAYECSLINLSANRTRLIVELLEHFQECGIQEQTDGKNIVLLFPEGMHTLLKNITLSSQLNSETLKLAAVAKLVHSEIFQGDESFKFDGKFPLDCQKHSVPYNLNLLISVILYGPNLSDEENDINSQSCLTISLLIMFNSKRRQTNPETGSTRHSAISESPLHLYIGLNIHSLVRSKRLIEQLYSLGISISYDRVMQIEKETSSNKSIVW